MFRRKTRNSTAYTGVSPALPAAHQPNNNAVAAALSIGENLKQTQPDVYGKPRAAGSLLKRSGLLQATHARTPAPPKTSRLLSYSSVSGGNQSGANTHLAANRSSGNGNATNAGGRTNTNSAPHARGAPGSAHAQLHVEYSVDDSFSESTLEGMGRDADAHYSNRAQLRDLQLHHTPAPPPPVKMVKRYIPTPNGIQIVEVPESTMKREIARSNLLRSGLSSRHSLMSRVSRLSSFSLTPAPRRKPQADRRASVLGSPRIEENEALERREAAETAAAEQRAESELLQRQIAEEEWLAAQLEQQRQEYERLRQLREANGRRMQELRTLEEEEHAAETVQEAPVSEGKQVQKVQSKDSTREESEDDEDVPIRPVPFAVDELDQMRVVDGDIAADTTTDTSADTSTEGPEVVADGPGGLVIGHEGADGTLSEVAALDGTVDDAPHAAVSDLPSDYSLEVPGPDDLQTSSPLRVPKSPSLADDFGIEEVPAAAFESPPMAGTVPEESPSPRFEPVPEIIAEGGRLTPPPATLAASIRSAGSFDSKSSRPIKSAMKMPRATYQTRAVAAESPAHQAYLSLTTAENTRLNSKLSSSQLDPTDARPSPPKSPVTPLKRMSQSLRKQPSNPAAGGLAARSLRPRSLSDASQPQRNGMSARTFKTQPQPLPPHPALQANYQSPSKVRAAELYERANNRPRSQFQPLARLSSFSKNPEFAQQEAPRMHEQAATHRTTLREQPQPQSHLHSQPQPQSQAAPQTSSNGFKSFMSRYADSDDEDTHRGSGGFLSRFNDSHDDLAAPREEAMHTPIVSLRQQKNSEPPKEKHKKKKFLRKLFGKK